MIQSKLMNFVLAFVSIFHRQYITSASHFNMQRVLTIGKATNRSYQEEGGEIFVNELIVTQGKTLALKKSFMLTSISARGSPMK